MKTTDTIFKSNIKIVTKFAFILGKILIKIYVINNPIFLYNSIQIDPAGSFFKFFLTSLNVIISHRFYSGSFLSKVDMLNLLILNSKPIKNQKIGVVIALINKKYTKK